MVGSLTLNSNTEIRTEDADKKLKKKDITSLTVITNNNSDKKVNIFKVCAIIYFKSVLLVSLSQLLKTILLISSTSCCEKNYCILQHLPNFHIRDTLECSGLVYTNIKLTSKYEHVEMHPIFSTIHYSFFCANLLQLFLQVVIRHSFLPHLSISLHSVYLTYTFSNLPMCQTLLNLIVVFYLLTQVLVCMFAHEAVTGKFITTCLPPALRHGPNATWNPSFLAPQISSTYLCI